MASHTVILTHSQDFPLVHQLRGELGEIELLCLDPQLLEHARAQGLAPRLHICRDNRLNREIYPAVRQEARGLQGVIDSALATLVPEARGGLWLQQELFYFLLTLAGYSYMGQDLAAGLDSDAVVHLIGPQAAFCYGQHSFTPALGLMQALGRKGRRWKAYTYDLPMLRLDRVPRLDELAVADFDRLCHLPTCFYDHASFEQELRAAGGRVLNIPSQVYDVKLPSLDTAPLESIEDLQARLDPAWVAACDQALAGLRERLRGLFQAQIAVAWFIDLQLELIELGLRRQLLFFAALEQAFGAQPARQLLISNHDAGLHGALLGHARRHRLQVLMVPHAKFFNAPVAELDGPLLCLSHALQGSGIVDGAGRSVPAAALGYAEPISLSGELPRPLRRLGVLLAGTSYNGLCAADMGLYLDGLRKLADWCRGRGVEFLLRCKPSDGFASLLAEHLGLPIEAILEQRAMGLAAWGAGCDLCLGYDVPTSGAIELLRQGTPMLHLKLRPLLPEEQALLHPQVVPHLDLDEGLQLLQQWQAEPSLLWRHGRQQHAAYMARQALARPLRDFLR